MHDEVCANCNVAVDDWTVTNIAFNIWIAQGFLQSYGFMVYPIQGAQLKKSTNVILELLNLPKSSKGELSLIFLLYSKYEIRIFVNGRHFPIWQPTLIFLIVTHLYIMVISDLISCNI